MARKSTYEKLIDAISKRLGEMSYENCDTIEEALRNDKTLSDARLASETTEADYNYCQKCNSVCFKGVCKKCGVIS